MMIVLKIKTFTSMIRLKFGHLLFQFGLWSRMDHQHAMDVLLQICTVSVIVSQPVVDSSFCF